jgi:2-methylisocitrate lyase-like PEP mutase family enzyme
VSVLSQRIRAGQFVLAPGVHDALAAVLAAEVGFDVAYLTGFGTAASLGLPDVGLVTMSEMVENLRRITAATDLAIIADADTGYGNAINVGRTIKEYERAGASGLHLEDQVFPKKCGFFEGKQVIPAQEHVQKIHAACDARGDAEFVIIARTDALAVAGWGDVEERVGLYREAGADVVFVDGIRTEQDLLEYARRVVDRGLPALYNGVLRPAPQIEQLGFRIQIIAGASLGAVVAGVWRAYEELYRHGAVPVEATSTFPRLLEVLGLPEIYAKEARYQVSGAP